MIMDTLHRFFEKIISAVFWQSLLTQLKWVDGFTGLILLAGFVYGARKGLLREIAELFELVLIAVFTLAFYPTLTRFFSIYLPSVSQSTLNPVSFFLTAAGVWFVVSVIDQYIQKWVHGKLTGFFKAVGGGVLGVIQFFVLWSFVTQAVLLLPLRSLHRMYEPGYSVSGDAVKNAVPFISNAVSNPSRYFSGQ